MKQENTKHQNRRPPMVRSMRGILGYRLDAEDGDTVGKVKDVLFDDERFVVRYMVADTGGWLSSHKVLISPHQIQEPDLQRQQSDSSFQVALTRAQIENAPLLEAAAPISRQYEAAFAEHYAHPPYWSGALIWGYHGSPGGAAIPPGGATQPIEDDRAEAIEETHLRSFAEVRKYDIRATDGDIGVLDDLIVECDTWRLRYVVVDINGWLPGGKRMLDIDWLDGFDFNGASAQVQATVEQVKHAPDFDPTEAVNVDYQARLYDYYGKPVHWEAPAPVV